MPRKTKTPEERLAALQRDAAQIRARIAKEKAKLTSAERKKDTRRKIIAGAIVLEHASHDAAFGDVLNKLLAAHVKADDRVLFGLPGPEKTDQRFTPNQE